MNPPYKLISTIGILLLIISPIICRESLKEIVKIDETEEYRIKDMLRYKEEDSIGNKPVVDSLRKELFAHAEDGNGAFYVFCSSIVGLGVGITVFTIGYKRYKRAKFYVHYTVSSKNP